MGRRETRGEGSGPGQSGVGSARMSEPEKRATHAASATRVEVRSHVSSGLCCEGYNHNDQRRQAHSRHQARLYTVSIVTVWQRDHHVCSSTRVLLGWAMRCCGAHQLPRVEGDTSTSQRQWRSLSPMTAVCSQLDCAPALPSVFAEKVSLFRAGCSACVAASQ